MTLKSAFKTAIAETASPLSLGKWNMIFVAYVNTHGGFGLTVIYVNGFQTTGYNSKLNEFVSSSLSSSDIITVGAGFIGKLKRLQIYSPSTYQLSSSIILLTIIIEVNMYSHVESSNVYY